jgi:hypothetical protein
VLLPIRARICTRPWHADTRTPHQSGILAVHSARTRGAAESGFSRGAACTGDAAGGTHAHAAPSTSLGFSQVCARYTTRGSPKAGSVGARHAQGHASVVREGAAQCTQCPPLHLCKPLRLHLQLPLLSLWRRCGRNGVARCAASIPHVLLSLRPSYPPSIPPSEPQARAHTGTRAPDSTLCRANAHIRTQGHWAARTRI